MEITLEKIELVKDRTGATYKEAKDALEAADGSVVDAIISIEETIDTDFEGISAENFKDSAAYKKMKELVAKGNMSRIVVKKEEEVILNFPLTAGVIGAIIVPWGMIFGIIATIGFKCQVNFVTSDGEVVDINGKVVGTYDMAKEASKKYTDKGQEVLDKIKESDAYNTIKDKGQEAYDKIKDSDVYDQITAKGQETLSNIKESDAYAQVTAKGQEAYNTIKGKGQEALNNIKDINTDAAKDKLDEVREKLEEVNIKENLEDIKKQAGDLFKKKEQTDEDAISDVDAPEDIDAVLDEMEKELESAEE